MGVQEKNHSDMSDRNLKCNLTIAIIIKYIHIHWPSNAPENLFHRIKAF